MLDVSIKQVASGKDKYLCFYSYSLLWLPYVIGRPLYFCPVVSIFFLFYFLTLSQRSEIGYLPYFHTCGLSANLECMSEMCCSLHVPRWKYTQKNRHFGTITQLCRAVSLQLRHASTIGEKLVKPQYLLHMSS